MTENCTSPSTAPPVMPVSIVPRSSKNVNSTESSGVLPPHQFSLRMNVHPVAASKRSRIHAPVPVLTWSSVVPVVKLAGVMHVWALKHETRAGRLPFGAARLNTATAGSVASTAPASMTPARPELAASTRRSIVAATSADVNGEPSCQVTPWRNWNVQTSAVSLGSHDSARPGAIWPSSPSVARNSNDWAQMP